MTRIANLDADVLPDYDMVRTRTWTSHSDFGSLGNPVRKFMTDQHGHTILNPKLAAEDFTLAVEVAQEEFDKHQPNMVVGS